MSLNGKLLPTCKWCVVMHLQKTTISWSRGVLPNRNFTDWIYTNVFESGKTDAFANQLSAIGSTNSGIVYEALDFH